MWRVSAADGRETVAPVAVEVLRYLDGMVLVRGALSADDRLVSAGVHRLIDGLEVQAIDRHAKAAL